MILHGQEAVDYVREIYRKAGRHMTQAERRIIMEEGYSVKPYKDSNGVTTIGVGQTGKYMKMPVWDAIQIHIDEARKSIPAYDDYPEYMKAEIAQLAYRGQLYTKGKTQKWVNLLNEGRYQEASAELLDHEKYKQWKAEVEDGTRPNGHGVVRRMDAAAKVISEFDVDPAGQISLAAAQKGLPSAVSWDNPPISLPSINVVQPSGWEAAPTEVPQPLLQDLGQQATPAQVASDQASVSAQPVRAPGLFEPFLDQGIIAENPIKRPVGKPVGA